MPLILNEEQEMLQDAANGFLKEKAPVTAFRKVRDNKPADGFCRELWAEMAEMGWAGIIVDEKHGGSGFGYVGAGVLAEEMGRNLTASPFSRLPYLALRRSSNMAPKSRKMKTLLRSAAASCSLPWRSMKGRATTLAASHFQPIRRATASPSLAQKLLLLMAMSLTN